MSLTKGKLVSFCIILLGVMTSCLLLLEYQTKRAVALKNATALIYKIQSDVLSLRRQEKDFLTRREKAYLVKFSNSQALVAEDLQELRNYLNQLHILEGHGETLELQLDNYAQQFKKITDIQLNLGLTPEEGMHGKLRDQAHRIEQMLAPLAESELMNALLYARRAEKDFMLRTQVNYLEDWKDKVQFLKESVTESQLTDGQKALLVRTIDNYEKNVRDFGEAMLKRGLTYEEGLLKGLSEIAGFMEQTLNHTSKRLLELSVHAEYQVHSYTRVLLLVFALGVLLLCIAPFVWSARKNSTKPAF